MPYTARPYVRMGRARVLNKWSISFWLKSSFRRVLRMWRLLLAFVSLSLTFSLNLQLGWKVSPSNTRLSHWGILLMGAYWWRVPLLSFFLNIGSLHLLGLHTQHLIIYTPTEKLIYQVCWRVWILPYGSYYSRVVSIFEKHGRVICLYLIHKIRRNLMILYPPYFLY